MTEISARYFERDITPEQFPDHVAQLLSEKTVDHIMIHTFRNLMRFNNDDGIVTYIGEYPRVPRPGSADRFKGSHTHLIDINDGGVYVGEGGIVFGVDSVHPASDNIPYVASTETAKDFLRQGLGTRRLKVMNLLAHELYGKPLSSDTEQNTVDEAKDLWRHLSIAGMAEKYDEIAGGVRYRFKD